MLPPTLSAVVSGLFYEPLHVHVAEIVASELFPAVAILQENLFDGAQCGEEVLHPFV